MGSINFRIATFMVAIFFSQSLVFANESGSPDKGEKTGSFPFTKKDKSLPQATANLKVINKHSFGLGIGQTFLLGDFAKYGDDRITGDLLYSYSASYSFDFLVNAHSSTHQSKGERTRVKGISLSIKSHLFEFDAFSPYLLGGLGFYWPQLVRELDGHTVTSDSQTTFGANFGGGCDLRLNPKFTFGIMGQLHKPFKMKQDYQPSVDGAYFKLLITGMYTF